MASVAHELRNLIHTFGMMLELCQMSSNFSSRHFSKYH